MVTEQELRQLVEGYPVRKDIQVDIITGPSYAGKTWVVNKLLDTHIFVKSTTTRAKREGEGDVEYNFISKDDFEQKLRNHEFVLAFILNGEYYGFLGIDLDDIINAGKKPIAIIYYKVLDEFLTKFPNSRIAFMYPARDNSGMDLLHERSIAREGKISEKRDKDTVEQMMFASSTNLAVKYPNSKYFEIIDNDTALSVIDFLQK